MLKACRPVPATASLGGATTKLSVPRLVFALAEPRNAPDNSPTGKSEDNNSLYTDDVRRTQVNNYSGDGDATTETT